MALIRFLVDYRGVLTDELFYEAGAVVDLPQAPYRPWPPTEQATFTPILIPAS